MSEFQTVSGSELQGIELSESELQSIEGGGTILGAILYAPVLAVVEIVLMTQRIVKAAT